MIKKITIILAIVISLTFSLFASADTVSTQQNFIYRFHLYYDNGQLFANRDFQFKYDVIPDDFTPETVNVANSFRGEIISGKGEILSSFKFDPRKGNLAFTKGAIAVDGPFFANAVEVNFYNAQNQKLLALNVSGSSFCDDDGTCNSDVGENYTNCPNDCPRPSPSPTYQPPTSSVWRNMLTPILVAVAVVVAALVIWFIIKRRRSLAGYDQNLPPQLPPTPPIQ